MSKLLLSALTISGLKKSKRLAFLMRGGENIMATIIKGVKLRLYPNSHQRDQLWQMFGNDRKV